MESDVTLLNAARRMDVDALTEIFDLYSHPLFRYALRLCNDALMADQIVGDVFSRLLEHLSVGSGPESNLRSYLFAMAYHIVIDEVRYSHRITPMEAVEFTLHDGGSSTYVSVENRVMFEAILQAVRNDLTDDQRHVIILRFMEGFSLMETAAIVGKKVGNVKVIQNRAIAVLREALDYQVVEINSISQGFELLLSH